MDRPKRSNNKYWIGTNNFNELQFAEDLEEYAYELEEKLTHITEPLSEDEKLQIKMSQIMQANRTETRVMPQGEPLPCPFCGALPNFHSWDDSYNTKYFLECDNNDCTVNPAAENEQGIRPITEESKIEEYNKLVLLWNKRTALIKGDKMTKELEEAIEGVLSTLLLENMDRPSFTFGYIKALQEAYEKYKENDTVENQVIQQKADEIYRLYPKIYSWTIEDAAIRNWYELAIRSDKTLQDSLVVLAELLFELKNKYYENLVTIYNVAHSM